MTRSSAVGLGALGILGMLELSGARPARAEDAGTRAISFADARAAAVRNAPDILLARDREAVARAQIDVAGTLGNPTVTVQSASVSARLGTAVSVPLPLFGQRSTAVAAARSDAAAVNLDTEAIKQEALWNATIAWLDLWEAQERARLLADAAQYAERLVTIAQQRFGAGSAPRVDVVRTTADRARARADATFANAAVSAAAARLAPWLGISGGGAAERGVAERGGPDLEPNLELRAAGAPGLATVGVELAVLEAQLAAHPAIRRDRAQAAAAAAHVRAEQRLRWPVVNAELAVNQFDPTQPGTDIVGGLSFEAPLLSLRGGAIARARAEQTLAETAAGVETRRLMAMLVDAYRRAEGAGARVQALGSEVLPGLEEVRRMTEEGYRDGRIDLPRLLEAQRALLENRVAHVEARAAWDRALADVERSVGVKLDGMASHAP